MKERALRIGQPTPLVGVITEPEQFDANRPAVLLLNSGIMHHIGSCRLSVKLARALAEAGFLCLRFDFSGIGDSAPRRGGLSFEQSAIQECAEVMDYLQQKRGIKKFILYGLCSGSDAAYETALVDERVIAISQIDAYCYRNWLYYWHYYWPRLWHAERWISTARRARNALTGRANKRSPSEVAGIAEEFFEVPTYTRIFPPQEKVEDGLKKLVARGVRLHVNFTGDEPAYNYPQQFIHSFRRVRFGNLLTLNYFPLANHIVTDPRHQQEVIGNIVGWATQKLAG